MGFCEHRVLQPALSRQRGSDDALAVYLHIPFCRVRCSYCAFNTYTDLDDLIPAYVGALCREIAYISPHDAQTVSSVYFGGGTPSRLTARQLAQLLGAVADSFRICPQAEISLEANPEDLSVHFAADLRRLGFNRLSIGMQSAQARLLRLYDRNHDLAAVTAALQAARRAGFDNVNLDLIFAAPGETLAEWEETVAQVLDYAPEHLSLYGLELKGGTKLRHAVDAGTLPAPDDDRFADMYELAALRLGQQGYEQYEISNWCRVGRQCRHNLQYWRNMPYIGLGAGAHGFAGGCRTVTIAAPQRYIAALEGTVPGGLPFPRSPATAKASRLSRSEEMAETIMMGMRLTAEGIDRAAFRARFGEDVADLCAEPIHRLQALRLLEMNGQRLRLTAAGRLLSNGIISALMQAAHP